MRRVVVTGLGIVAPTGNSVSEAWKNAVSGRTAVSRITSFDPSALPTHIAAEVKGFDPLSCMEQKDANRASRFVQFAAGAAKEALLDSGLPTGGDNNTWGTSIGVGMGALERIDESSQILREKGHRRVSPFFLPFTITNMAAGFVSISHNLRGPNICTTTACTSGTHGVGEAWLYIRNGMADVMVAGGAEACICPLGVVSFTSMKALSTRNDDPASASRPFDKDRDGFVMGEGAGVLVLEEYEHARRRGAKIYAEMVGYGMSGDANHITAPSPGGEGGERCMRMALHTAGINGDQLDYINAHGTSTKLNDMYETAAIKRLIGPAAAKVSVSSTKGVTGHCLGAAGGIEAVYTSLAIHHKLVPPTAGYTTADPDCDLDYTPGSARERTIRYAMSNSFGFGGTNGAIVMRSL